MELQSKLLELFFVKCPLSTSSNGFSFIDSSQILERIIHTHARTHTNHINTMWECKQTPFTPFSLGKPPSWKVIFLRAQFFTSWISALPDPTECVPQRHASQISKPVKWITRKIMMNDLSDRTTDKNWNCLHVNIWLLFLKEDQIYVMRREGWINSSSTIQFHTHKEDCDSRLFYWLQAAKHEHT